MEAPEVRKISVSVPIDMHSKLKAEAAMDGVTIGSATVDAIRFWLKGRGV